LSILATFGLTQADLELVRDVVESTEISVEQLSDEFFVWLQKQEDLERFFPEGPPDSERARQIEYWQQFLRADISEQYLDSVCARPRFGRLTRHPTRPSPPLSGSPGSRSPREEPGADLCARSGR